MKMVLFILKCGDFMLNHQQLENKNKQKEISSYLSHREDFEQSRGNVVSVSGLKRASNNSQDSSDTAVSPNSCVANFIVSLQQSVLVWASEHVVVET
jgi:hypothetical protein